MEVVWEGSVLPTGNMVRKFVIIKKGGKKEEKSGFSSLHILNELFF